MLFDPLSGWGPALAIESGAGNIVAVATGNCGDDVLVAWDTTDFHIRSARVQGSAIETRQAMELGSAPTILSMSSRQSTYAGD
jgi:hypothetical protein